MNKAVLKTGMILSMMFASQSFAGGETIGGGSIAEANVAGAAALIAGAALASTADDSEAPLLHPECVEQLKKDLAEKVEVNLAFTRFDICEATVNANYSIGNLKPLSK